MAEGVGFEPTLRVAPRSDFESGANGENALILQGFYAGWCSLWGMGGSSTVFFQLRLTSVMFRRK
jgi:hypothetical protein